jgi:hypothetical protein
MKNGIMLRLIAAWAVLAGMVPAGRAQSGEDFCPILDRFDDTVWGLHFTVLAPSKVKGAGDTTMLQVGGEAGVFFLRTDFGELDVRAEWLSTAFTSRADIQLPQLLTLLRVNLDYTLRLPDNYALRVGFAPGLYSQITHVDADHLFYPFRLHGIYTFDENLSALAGLNLYPGFSRIIEPQLGVRWQISDYLLLDAFYPQSEMVFRPNVDWAIRAGVAFLNAQEYGLKKSDDRHQFSMEETRLYAGVDRVINHQLLLMLRFGRVVDRNFDFKRQDRSRDVEDALFFQVGVGGLL